MQKHLRKGVHVLKVPSQVSRILELWKSNRTGFQDVQPEIQEPSSPSAVSLNQQKEVHATQGSATKNPPPKGSGFWEKAIPQGLEPRTVCLEGRCSILLSYGTMPSPVGNVLQAQRCGGLATPRMTGTKKGAASMPPLFHSDEPSIVQITVPWSSSPWLCRHASCSSWTSCRLHLRPRPWSSIRQKKTCCKTHPWRP